MITLFFSFLVQNEKVYYPKFLMKQSKSQNTETTFFATQKKTVSNAQIVDQNSQKLVRLNYLLQNSTISTTSLLRKQKERSQGETQKAVDLSKDVSLYVSLVKKPINLLFSLDQFLFEFSKKTYQQKKTGEFFQQLKERKKLSLFYGHLSQKSLTKLFHKATQSKGFFSKNVLCLLERRLDVVLYRSGFTQTIAESRQCIAHRKVLVNGKPRTFPSFQVEPGDILSIAPTRKINDHLLKSLKTGQSQNDPKMVAPRSSIAEDFFRKLKKNLKPLPHFSTTSKNFDSKLVCLLFINFLCTQIKKRAFYNLKHTTLTRGDDKSLFLTFLKWKLLGNRTPKKMTFHKTRSFWNQKETQFNKNAQKVVYPHLGYIRQHPVFWNRELINSKYTPFVFGKNQGQSFKFQQKNRRALIQKNDKRREILQCYRHCFLVFLKHLENDTKFHGLVDLHFKKFMSTTFFYKHKESFSKTLAFRVVKPLHLEISYKLFHVIYLYSPQRVNFPFYIDLDLIRRSLR